MKTRITKMLGIKYPIILAPMAWITDADLAAAVSNAGGLGTIGPNAGFKTVTTDVEETGERLREQIRKYREMSDKPFAVNFVVGVVGWDRDYSDKCVQVGIEERVPVAIVSQGSPLVYTQRLKEAGMKVIQVCSIVKHVKKAEEAGVDAVVCSGTEGGGHSGFDQVTTLCLVPQAADAVSIPVIAGGGIVDARGLMGALALGADGVYMGTRFMVTQECPAHPNVKDLVLETIDTGTIPVRHGNPIPIDDKKRGDRGFVEERRGSVRMVINDYIGSPEVEIRY
jgi:NAD(P)H-dependent flavin oxidoreductase YrpB (nitropropane dioxygenase family)